MNEQIGNVNYYQAKRDFDVAHRQALWQKFRNLLGRKCNDLLPAEHILKSLHNQESHSLGLQIVPLDKIVGSSGRYREFDLSFRPLGPDRDGRWQSIARARRQGINLPPPLLYQVGSAYFVEDGNHRISVAAAAGQETIEAQVIAIDPSALPVSPSCTRLGYRKAGSETQNGSKSCHR